MSSTAVTASPETPETEPVEAKVLVPFTAYDRCDSCGAQAYVRYEREEQDFIFCGHHAVKSDTKLLAIGFEVTQDETHKLTPNRLQGSDH